jgi:uncharacterized protein (DUF302 family)
MKAMRDYEFTKELNLPYEKAALMVREALQKEGFGIVTEINIKEKLKEKLSIEFKKYTILGACNPPFALRALKIEENVGLLLPCNVVLYEKDGKTVLAIMRPTAAMSMVDNPELQAVATEIERKLKHVYEAVH